MLQVENLSVRLGSLDIVRDASFELREGQWLMVVGPNGAGKSTLVNALGQSLPYTGTVRFDGEDITQWPPARLAQRMGMLMQTNTPGYAFTVEEVVRLGRYAWGHGPLGGPHSEDDTLVEAALAQTGLAGLRRQSVLTLSGGELQRTFLAQLLAQNPRVMVLDEPANHLDLAYQQQVFRLVGEWVVQPGRAAISVVHDLSLAKAYGTHALLLNKGRVAAQGEVQRVLQPENLNTVYGMDVAAWMQGMLAQWEDSY